MIPVLWRNRIVGYLPPMCFHPGAWFAEYSIMPDLRSTSWPRDHDVVRPPLIQTVRLRIRDQRASGEPGELHADYLAGVCELRGFVPEDWALSVLRPQVASRRP